jgi:hypothetical protein
MCVWHDVRNWRCEASKREEFRTVLRKGRAIVPMLMMMMIMMISESKSSV